MKITAYTKQLKGRKRIWLRYSLGNNRKEYEPTDFYLYKDGNGVKDKETLRAADRLAKRREEEVIEEIACQSNC